MNRKQSARSGESRQAKAGFSLVELLVVLAILAILTSIILPNVLRAVYKGRAAKVVTDMTRIRMGAQDFYNDKSTWPANTAFGTVPKLLVSYLPPGTDFNLPRWGVSYALTNYSTQTDDWVAKNGYRVALRIKLDRRPFADVVYKLSKNLFAQTQFSKTVSYLTVVLE
jgi:prepilin-type N-terminal cleavage/methylation domain-containing protein